MAVKMTPGFNINYAFEVVKRDDFRRLVFMHTKHPECVDYKDKEGNTLLLKAAQHGHQIITKFLLYHGSDFKAINVHGMNALCLASYSGSMDCAKWLLSYWPYASYTAMSTMPPLCVAAMCGHLEMVRFFCKLDYPGHVATIHGMTPLMLAAAYGRKDVVMFFRNSATMRNARNALGDDFNSLVEGLKKEHLCK